MHLNLIIAIKLLIKQYNKNVSCVYQNAQLLGSYGGKYELWCLVGCDAM
jgi:hypothetical protein